MKLLRVMFQLISESSKSSSKELKKSAYVRRWWSMAERGPSPTISRASTSSTSIAIDDPCSSSSAKYSTGIGFIFFFSLCESISLGTVNGVGELANSELYIWKQNYDYDVVWGVCVLGFIYTFFVLVLVLENTERVLWRI